MAEMAVERSIGMVSWCGPSAGKGRGSCVKCEGGASGLAAGDYGWSDGCWLYEAGCIHDGVKSSYRSADVALDNFDQSGILCFSYCNDLRVLPDMFW